MVNNDSFWERGTFTVPDGVPLDKVKYVAADYMSRMGRTLERKGYRVERMLPPRESIYLIPYTPGRTRYDVYAFISKKPELVHYDIPDQLVPEMEALGLKLNE